MTKRHFEAIAAILRDYPPAKVMSIGLRLADYFASENPRFDRERFLTACGFGS